MAQLTRTSQSNGSHITSTTATATVAANPGATNSNLETTQEDLQANDNIENDTIGSGSASESSSSEDEEEFPPLIPGPGGIHIFIERDYRFTPRLVFPESMPSDLLHIEGLQIHQPRFEALIRKLNSVYSKTEHVGCMSVFETLVQLASCYVSLLCCGSQYERYIDQADRLISVANEDWKRDGVPLFLLSPRERGMRCLELIAMPTARAATTLARATNNTLNGRALLHSSEANVPNIPTTDVRVAAPHSLNAENGRIPTASGQLSDPGNTSYGVTSSLRSESIEMGSNGNLPAH